MSEGAVAVNWVSCNWGGCEEEMKVKRKLEKLEEKVQDATVPCVSIDSGQGRVRGDEALGEVAKDEVEDLEKNKGDSDDNQIGRERIT